jgi:hypothetical protein
VLKVLEQIGVFNEWKDKALESIIKGELDSK